jgi:murein L,D-transpeptidase YafK
MKIFFKFLISLFIICGILVLGIIVYYYYPEKKLNVKLKIDELKVYKSKRLLEAYSQGKLEKTYQISLGKVPKGKKEVEGDIKTPEGSYIINAKNDQSTCYKNLGINYPNNDDRINAKSLQKSTGGDIKIHGMLNGNEKIGKFHRWKDWTAGCIAVTNQEMNELYNAVEIGTPIIIYP